MRTKLLPLILLVMLTALALSGCGGSATSTPAVPTATADVPTAIPTSPPADITATVLQPPGTPTVSTTAQPSASTPEDAITSFYNWYISQKPSPLASGAYKTSPYLTDELIQKVNTQMMSASPNVTSDPFLCSLNPAISFTVDPAVISGDQATTIVHTVNDVGSGSNLNMTLQMDKGQWKIAIIACLLGQ